MRDEYRYTIATTAFDFGTQVTVIPHHNKLRTTRDEWEMDRANRLLRFIDNREAFPQLIALANQIVEEKVPGGTVTSELKRWRHTFRNRDCTTTRWISTRSMPNAGLVSIQLKILSATTARATASILPVP